MLTGVKEAKTSKRLRNYSQSPLLKYSLIDKCSCVKLVAVCRGQNPVKVNKLLVGINDGKQLLLSLNCYLSSTASAHGWFIR